jgi:type I restriction enzyme R subunit
VLPTYLRAIDYVFAQDDGWKTLPHANQKLAAAFALVIPRPETEEIVEHLAFFQRLVAMIRKRLADESRTNGPARRRDVDAAVREVVGEAVDAGEVIELFAAAGLDEANLDILSDEFLSRVAALEQRNLALETLRKLLQIKSALPSGRISFRASACEKLLKTQCFATRIRRSRRPK